MFLQLFHRRLQFFIPLRAELAYERLLQELVDGQVLLPPQQDRRLADIPTVVVHPLEGAEVLHADGIKMAGHGFEEIRLARATRLLDGAIAATLLVIAGEHAVLPVDDGGQGESSSQMRGRSSSIFSTSSNSRGAPASPSMQQAPRQALRSQRNFSFNTSKLTMTSPTCSI